MKERQIPRFEHESLCSDKYSAWARGKLWALYLLLAVIVVVNVNSKLQRQLRQSCVTQLIPKGRIKSVCIRHKLSFNWWQLLLQGMNNFVNTVWKINEGSDGWPSMQWRKDSCSILFILFTPPLNCLRSGWVSSCFQHKYRKQEPPSKQKHVKKRKATVALFAGAEHQQPKDWHTHRSSYRHI